MVRWRDVAVPVVALGTGLLLGSAVTSRQRPQESLTGPVGAGTSCSDKSREGGPAAPAHNMDPPPYPSAMSSRPPRAETGPPGPGWPDSSSRPRVEAALSEIGDRLERLQRDVNRLLPLTAAPPDPGPEVREALRDPDAPLDPGLAERVRAAYVRLVETEIDREITRMRFAEDQIGSLPAVADREARRQSYEADIQNSRSEIDRLRTFKLVVSRLPCKTWRDFERWAAESFGRAPAEALVDALELQTSGDRK